MKIYRSVTIDIITGRVLEEDSFEYSGPVALCKGGGSQTSTTVDPIYNARMAAISEKNQVYADQMFNMFKYGVTYDPTVKVANTNAAQVTNPEWTKWNSQSNNRKWVDNIDPESGTSNGGYYEGADPGPEPEKTIPDPKAMTTTGALKGYDPNTASEMSLMQARVQSDFDIQPLEAQIKKDTLGVQAEYQPKLLSSLYEDALSGVDVEKKVGQARTGVMAEFTNVEEQQKRNFARLGVDPSSGAAASAMKDTGIQKSLALAGAGTSARERAEAESFARKKAVAGVGV